MKKSVIPIIVVIIAAVLSFVGPFWYRLGLSLQSVEVYLSQISFDGMKSMLPWAVISLVAVFLIAYSIKSFNTYGISENYEQSKAGDEPVESRQRKGIAVISSVIQWITKLHREGYTVKDAGATESRLLRHLTEQRKARKPPDIPLPDA